MSRENLLWFDGPITHAHIRYVGEANINSSGEVLQFDHETALQYLQLLTGKPNVRITDTNHAMLSLDADNLVRPSNEDVEVWKENIVYRASEETGKRIAEIRSSLKPNIIVGIEVDIVDDQGSLSLSDECLRQSDFTIASFHRYIWTVFSGRKNYKPSELIDMYLGVLNNPLVSVLGHPTIPSSKMVGRLKPEDYLSVVEKMGEKGIAYEVSILNDLSSAKEDLTRGVLKICGEMNTALVLSSDFHNFPDLVISKDLPIKNQPNVTGLNLEELFRQNQSVHYSIFRRLNKNVEVLRDLGIREEQVVNSTDQRFDEWLAERKSLSY